MVPRHNAPRPSTHFSSIAPTATLPSRSFHAHPSPIRQPAPPANHPHHPSGLAQPPTQPSARPSQPQTQTQPTVTQPSTQKPPVPVSLPSDLKIEASSSLPANYYANDKRHYPTVASNAFLAQIHGYGVFGFASLTPVANKSGEMDIKIRLEGGPPKEEYSLKIYSLPTQLGSPCMASLLGPLIYDLTFDYGALSSKDELRYRTKMVDIMKRGILGRTLLIQGLMSGIRICSIILTGSPTQLYQAKFHSPIAGMAYLMHTPIEAALGTEWMMYSNGQRKFSSHSWSLIKADSEEADPKAIIKNEKEKCANLKGIQIHDSIEKVGFICLLSVSSFLLNLNFIFFQKEFK